MPPSLGGGGGIWGWGGVAYSAKRDSIYVVTGNAFEGGSNKGAKFSEEAGYGEHVVELSPGLDVRSSDAPDLTGFTDLDYVGSPVVADTADCGEIVAAQAKNGMLFGWDAGSLDAGPLWSVKLQKADPGAPLLTQPTWSPAYRSFFVASASKLVRIGLGTDCKPKVAWQTTLGDATLYPSPTVAGGTVWIGLPVKDLSGVAEALLGVDARTGRVTVRKPMGGVSFAPPTALPGMLFVATMHGLAAARFPVAHGRPVSTLPEYTSRLDDRHVWQSREDGVYSTDDGGRHWKRIYPAYCRARRPALGDDGRDQRRRDGASVRLRDAAPLDRERRAQLAHRSRNRGRLRGARIDAVLVGRRLAVPRRAELPVVAAPRRRSPTRRSSTPRPLLAASWRSSTGARRRRR